MCGDDVAQRLVPPGAYGQLALGVCGGCRTPGWFLKPTIWIFVFAGEVLIWVRICECDVTAANVVRGCDEGADGVNEKPRVGLNQAWAD